MASGSTRSAPAARRPSGTPRTPTRRRRRRGGRILRGIGWIVLALAVLLGSTAAGLLAAPVDFTPSAPPRPALILDRNGKVIGEIASTQQQVEVTAAQIPDVMRNAIVAAEDKTFYSNAGVDPLSIVRAALSNVSGDPTQGGSTITQQYVKNVFVGNQRTYVRKLREAALAIRLDQRLSKQEILTRYLNIVYFGQDTYGVQAAAQYYFGVDAAKLTLSQAAMLAGIVPAPSEYNPVASLTLARQRQQYVLNRMVDAGYIDTATASAAYANVPVIVKHLSDAVTVASVAPQFIARVKAQVKKLYADQTDVLNRGGLGIRTTLDVSWQQAANDALKAVLPKASDPEASVVIMNSDDGSILGLADKVDANHPALDTSESSRKSGSSVKPFTLATALENGYHLDDYTYGPSSKTYSQTQCPNMGKDYTITNDEGGGGGYTLTSALAQSVNTVYGPLAIKLGTSKVAAVAQAAGLLKTVKPDDTVCSMGLGVAVTPRDEAVAYSTLADDGMRHDARDLLSINAGVNASGGGGGTIYTAPAPVGTQAIPAAVAGQVQTAMRAVVKYGTATAAQQPAGLDVYGKTGTTDDFTNAWFSGCIPSYHVCVATWMGYDKQTTASGTPNSMRDVEGVHDVVGGSLPAKIFAQTMDGYRTRVPPPLTASATPTPTPTSTSASASASASAPTTFVPRSRRPTFAPSTSVPPSTEATRSVTAPPPSATVTGSSGSPVPPISPTAARSSP